MFDSKKLLDALISGAMNQGGQQGQQAGAGGLGDLLGQVLGGGARGQAAAPQQGGAGGLGDILGQLLGGAQGGQQATPQAGQQAGGLQDILGQLLGGAQQTAQNANQGVQNAGGLGGILGSLLGQATDGVRDVAGKANEATGAQAKLEDLLAQATGGKVPADVLQQIKDLIAQNQMAAGAAAGGLGGLLLGTKTGRSITVEAAKLGGLALIGGLAYKAYQNYMEGKPLIQFGEPVPAPPKNSAFNPATGDAHQHAVLMIRGMIAAAASDGTIDEAEKKAILGNMQTQGMDQATMNFLNHEVQNPADASTLASEVQGPEQATALYTACRMAIDMNNKYEQRFMADLAEAMGLEDALVEQADSAATSVRHAA